MKIFKIKSTNKFDGHGNELFLVETYFGDRYYGDNIWTRKEIKDRERWDNAKCIWLDNAVKSVLHNDDEDDNIF